MVWITLQGQSTGWQKSWIIYVKKTNGTMLLDVYVIIFVYSSFSAICTLPNWIIIDACCCWPFLLASKQGIKQQQPKTYNLKDTLL